jgi:hypothetical protein
MTARVTAAARRLSYIRHHLFVFRLKLVLTDRQTDRQTPALRFSDRVAVADGV